MELWDKWDIDEKPTVDSTMIKLIDQIKATNLIALNGVLKVMCNSGSYELAANKCSLINERMMRHITEIGSTVGMVS